MGEKSFFILRPPAPPGYSWVQGCLTKTQTTSRHGNVWPEVWDISREAQEGNEIAERNIEKPKRDGARNKTGIVEVQAGDKELNAKLREAGLNQLSTN